MIQLLLWLMIFLLAILGYGTQPAMARSVKPVLAPPAIIACYSGGQEILRKTLIAGPFADEYKFAHEVKVLDGKGEHNLNFAGGLCIIDRGEVASKQQSKLSDQLRCYSAADQIVTFQVYGRETTVDEYVEGRTFLAKARGNSFNSDSLHEYLVFGGGACIGEES